MCGTSVSVDNTILPLSGLDGDQWARVQYMVCGRQTHLLRFIKDGTELLLVAHTVSWVYFSTRR